MNDSKVLRIILQKYEAYPFQNEPLDIHMQLNRKINGRFIAAPDQRKRILKMTLDILENCNDLIEWLLVKGYIKSFNEATEIPSNFERLRLTERAWLKYLIARCEAEENRKDWVIRTNKNQLANRLAGRVIMIYVSKATPTKTSFGSVEHAIRFATKEGAERFLNRTSIFITCRGTLSVARVPEKIT